MASLAGILFWLGLSPQVARALYEKALMPRLRSTDQIWEGAERSPARAVYFMSESGNKLEGRLYANPESDKLVVYFGGRTSNLFKNSERARAFYEAGLSVFISEYGGFGGTPGRASAGSIVADGLAAFDKASELGYSLDKIIIYGESLGVAVASYVSSKRRASAIILQSGFASLATQLKEMVPFLRIYPGFMFPMQELTAAKNLLCDHPPLLILHGDRDRVVRPRHARLLASAGGGNTSLVILEGAEHFQVFKRQDWRDNIRKFLDSIG